MWFKKSGEDDLFQVVCSWLPFAIVIVALAGLVEVAVQQHMRTSANDPQIQLAEDVAAVLTRGMNPASVVSGVGAVNMARSLAPFVMIFDAAGKPMLSTGQLNGATPAPPAGVFRAALARGENRRTWQPQGGVRIAAVIKPYGGPHPGFVLAGRSLREVEQREANLGRQVMLVLSFALLATFGAVFFTRRVE